MVFQSYALYPHMTVRENMGFALKLAKTPEERHRREGQRGGPHPRPDAASRPQAGEPVRRPAAAGRDGPRDRPRPGRLPDGRAAVQPRREAARADAYRGFPPPAAARHHHGLRDTRPDRGDDARRPRRRDAQRPPAAGGITAGALRSAEEPVRRRLHRVASDELHGGHPRGRQTAHRAWRPPAERPAAARDREQRGRPRRDRRHPPGKLRGRVARLGRRTARTASRSARPSTSSSPWARTCSSTSPRSASKRRRPPSSRSSPGTRAARTPVQAPTP